MAAPVYVLIPHMTEPYVALLDQRGGWSLPSIEPGESYDWQVVSPINQALQAQYEIETTVLRCVSPNDVKVGSAQRIYILENHTSSWTVPAGGRWVAQAELDQLALAIPEHRTVLETWFTEAAGGDIPALRRPWARVGWLDEAIAWIQAQLNQLGLTATGPVRQLRSWERSCVLQVSTDAGCLYFKAVPALLAHELPLTQALAGQYPVHIPQILATDPKRHWMLVADFAGRPLSQIQDIACWQSALRRYAEIQIDLADRTDCFMGLGCPDRRLDQLAAQIDPVLADLAKTSLSQEFSQVEIDQLRALAPQLKEMCADLASFRVPQTLEHGDFHTQNIVLTGRSTLYIDWSDSAIAHPFFSLSLFFRSIERGNWFPGFSSVRPSLCSAYLEPWTAFEPMSRLAETFNLAQTLEVLHHAITYHQMLLPSIEDKSAWAAIAPSHLKTLLCNSV